MAVSPTEVALRDEISVGTPGLAAAARSRGDSAEYLFAGFIGLAIVTIITPVRSLHALLPWRLIALLPLATCQDMFLLAVMAWLFHGLFAIAKPRWARRLVAVTGWTVCLLLALYTYLSGIIYLIIRRPLTFGLLAAADNLRGIQSSIDAIATPGLIAALALAPAYVVLIATLFECFAPGAVRQLRGAFHSAAGLLLTVIFLVGAHSWAVRYVPLSLASFNPQWTLMSSLFELHTPVVTDAIPDGYLADFQPVGMRPASVAGPLVGVGFEATAPREPLNVLMVVMESVGAHRVQLYGAPYDDTPNLVELARHALVFNRAYVAEAETSAALGALFASVYPDHDWPSITQLAPELAIPGLPAVLSSKGYRTAFMHSGQLAFDRQGEFLRSRGFAQVIDKKRDYDVPEDPALLTQALGWIKADSSRPFFLTLWTQDTHHPYLATEHRDYGVHDAYLNRYLNAVHATDAIIGELAAALRSMGLADRTLLVITGDHGEAFGEHGQLIHGGTVYNEEVQVPLLIVNPKLFPHEVTIKRIVRQIDIAPTVLALLGYRSPAQWQGDDVLGAHPPVRAYLFAGTGNFSFGLIEGDFKYIYNFQRDRAQLYDLATDPGETRNLVADDAYAALMRRDHLRLEAWVSFQNRYLARFENSPARHGAQPARTGG
ncbi:MAG TPA: sulfatase [Candidatus Binataceae bacterium]|nr:sulfatase [Candidatus Binataceae bacterium]